jgi:hypothetical protein
MNTLFTAKERKDAREYGMTNLLRFCAFCGWSFVFSGAK